MRFKLYHFIILIFIFLFKVGRLEEKEAELKREYSRLHDRYTELFKTHVDYMERTKMLVGSTERLESVSASRAPSRLPSLGLAHMSRSSGPLSYGFQSLEASISAEDVHEDIVPNTANLRTEMLDSSSEAAIETSDKSQLTDQPVQENKTTAISRRTLHMICKSFLFATQKVLIKKIFLYRRKSGNGSTANFNDTNHTDRKYREVGYYSWR